MDLEKQNVVYRVLNKSFTFLQKNKKKQKTNLLQYKLKFQDSFYLKLDLSRFKFQMILFSNISFKMTCLVKYFIEKALF